MNIKGRSHDLPFLRSRDGMKLHPKGHPRDPNRSFGHPERNPTRLKSCGGYRGHIKRTNRSTNPGLHQTAGTADLKGIRPILEVALVGFLRTDILKHPESHLLEFDSEGGRIQVGDPGFSQRRDPLGGAFVGGSLTFRELGGAKHCNRTRFCFRKAKRRRIGVLLLPGFPSGRIRRKRDTSILEVSIHWSPCILD